MKIIRPFISAVLISTLVILAACGPGGTEAVTTVAPNNVPTITTASALQKKNVVAEIFTGEW